MTQKILSESPALRSQICSGSAQNLLDHLGKIDLISEIGGATKASVCEYYQISFNTLNAILKRNREELIANGYKIFTKNTLKMVHPELKMVHYAPFLKGLSIPKRGLSIFPPSAILAVGLLLRDSERAKDLRLRTWQYIMIQKQEFFNEEVLLESRSFRDSYCLEVNLSILDLVGLLATLTDTAWSTVEQVAEFYRVGIEAIQSIIKRYRDELTQDGLKLLSRKDLKNVHFEHFTDITIPRRGLAIIPRRAVLRIAMLLRDSKVAKDVRSYLLQAESLAPWRKSLSPAKKEVDLKVELERLQETVQNIQDRQDQQNTEIHRKLDDHNQRFHAIESRIEHLGEILRDYINRTLQKENTLVKSQQGWEKERQKRQDQWREFQWEKEKLLSEIRDFFPRIHHLENRMDSLEDRLNFKEEWHLWWGKVSQKMGDVILSLEALFTILADGERFYKE